MEPNKNLTATPSCSSSASGSGRWFGGWGGIAVGALVGGGAVLAFGGTQNIGGTLNIGAWLPLLLVLACPAMMFMCMKGMGSSQR